MSNIVSFKDEVYAGVPAIVYNTSEENVAIEECAQIAKKTGSRLFVWSLTAGLCERIETEDANGNPLISNKYHAGADKFMPPYSDVLTKIFEINGDTKSENIIYAILDYHPFIKTPEVWRTAKDVFQKAKENFITYVFISNKFDIPIELEHEVISVNMEWPDEEDFMMILDCLVRQNDRYANVITEEEQKLACKAALGLTLAEAENAFSIALSKSDKLDTDIINHVKKEIICKDGLLEYQRSKESNETVGGMEPFIDYVEERYLAYSDDAKKYGLPFPKGVLLVGIPGCGKSLAAKALSNIWKVPLFKLELGKLFGAYVGDTESNTRKALKIAEAMSPCVLWLDEIEKGLAGAGNSGKMDSGVTSRMFGNILNWLQEKDKPVYVIATANNISVLPSELTRKGRFDEIFFIDLPDLEGRKKIAQIQVKKHNGKPELFDFDKIAAESDGFNGAEIEEAVISAMFKGFKDNKRDYNTDDVILSMKKIQPASKGIMEDTVTALRKWAKENNVRNANNEYMVTPVVEVVTTGRKIKSQAEQLIAKEN